MSSLEHVESQQLADTPRHAVAPRNGHAPLLPQGPREHQPADLESLIAMAFRRRWVMVGTVLITLIIGTLFTMTRRPVYEASAEIVVVTGNGSSGSGDSIPLISDLQALTRSRSVDTQVAIVSSKSVLKSAWSGLSPELRAKGFRSRDIPSWAFRVMAQKNTDVIDVTTSAYDPDAAAELANSIVRAYFSRDLHRNQRATRQAREYASDQMRGIKADLGKANEALSSYKQKTGIISVDAELQKLAEHIAKLQLDRDDAKVDLAATTRQSHALADQFTKQQTDVIAGSTITRNPEFSAVLDSISRLNSERASLLQEYAPSAKEIRQVDGQIRSERDRLKSIAETVVSSVSKTRNPIRESLLGDYCKGVASLAAAGARVSAVDSALRATQARAKALPEQERVLTERIQKVALLQRTYEMLSEKYYALLISERSALPGGELITEADAPLSPTYPRKSRDVAASLLFGVLLSVLVAALFERLDCRMHAEDITDGSMGLTLLSMVPDIPEGTSRLIYDQRSNSLLLESYRILRNNIGFSSIDRPSKLLAVTSPGRGEGKSTTSVNLAIAMAMSGKRVILIDCDLRRPSVHKLVGIPRELGFTTVATGGSTLEDAVSPTKVENLFVLPSGPLPPNPSEFLDSRRSREVIRLAAERFDMVILDCPPCTGLSDVQVIGTLVDSLLLLVSVEHTLRPQFQLALRTLSQANAPLIGAIANRMQLRRPGYYGYYYYYSYSEDEQGQLPRCKSRKSLSGHHRPHTKR